MNLTAPGRDGVDATNVPQFAAADLDVSTPGADGIALAGDGSLGQGFVLNRNTISGAPGAGIRVSAATAGAGDASGAITANTITATGPGDGIDVSADHAGQLIVDLTANTLAGLAAGTGIDARSLGGADLELTLVGNGVTMSGSAAGDAVSVSEGGASTGTVCVDPRQNALASTGAGAYDIALAQLTPSGTFGLENYVAPASVTGFLAGANTLGANGPFADAAGNANGFTSGTCRTPLQQNG